MEEKTITGYGEPDHRARDGVRESGKLRVVIANDPRAYRQAIAAALAALRPALEVIVADPGVLDLEVQRGSPGVVVCTRATLVVERKALVWVELYPDGGRLGRASFYGRRSTIANIGFRDLLSIIDSAEARARAS